MKILAVVLVAVGIYFGPTAVIRAFDPNTKLGYLEDSVEGVSIEFMRRSPALRGNFEKFRVCARQSGCDYSVILKERDQIIPREWPAIFDRLAVRGDWWRLLDAVLPSTRYESSEQDRDSFFDELKKRGTDMLRNHCVPVIAYKFDRREDSTTYDTMGFNCNSKSAA